MPGSSGRSLQSRNDDGRNQTINAPYLARLHHIYKCMEQSRNGGKQAVFGAIPRTPQIAPADPYI